MLVVGGVCLPNSLAEGRAGEREGGRGGASERERERERERENRCQHCSMFPCQCAVLRVFAHILHHMIFETARQLAATGVRPKHSNMYVCLPVRTLASAAQRLIGLRTKRRLPGQGQSTTDAFPSIPSYMHDSCLTSGTPVVLQPPLIISHHAIIPCMNRV